MTVTEKNGTDRNKILLVNDLASYGKVALSAMLPILSHMGFELFTLPTALVSNTLDYGKFEILDTKDYIRETLRIWQELGFSFDAVATGFLASDEEAELLAVFCAEERKKGTLICADPGLGDDGSLYHGIGEAAVENRKKLLSVADIIKPNYTEACLLTGSAYDETGNCARREKVRWSSPRFRCGRRTERSAASAMTARAGRVFAFRMRKSRCAFPAPVTFSPRFCSAICCGERILSGRLPARCGWCGL